MGCKNKKKYSLYFKDEKLIDLKHELSQSFKDTHNLLSSSNLNNGEDYYYPKEKSYEVIRILSKNNIVQGIQVEFSRDSATNFSYQVSEVGNVKTMNFKNKNYSKVFDNTILVYNCNDVYCNIILLDLSLFEKELYITF